MATSAILGTQILLVIVSDAVDYRYGSRDGIENEMSAYELPDAIRDRCVRLSKALNLPLCGIDFKRTPDGEYVCFEVNPSPAFSYYEENAGQPISTAIGKTVAEIDGELGEGWGPLSGTAAPGFLGVAEGQE